MTLVLYFGQPCRRSSAAPTPPPPRNLLSQRLLSQRNPLVDLNHKPGSLGASNGCLCVFLPIASVVPFRLPPLAETVRHPPGAAHLCVINDSFCRLAGRKQWTKDPRRLKPHPLPPLGALNLLLQEERTGNPCRDPIF